jgi:hypothetical protein
MSRIIKTRTILTDGDHKVPASMVGSVESIYVKDGLADVSLKSEPKNDELTVIRTFLRVRDDR